MPIHQTVAKHGDAAQLLVNAVGAAGKRSKISVGAICRSMAADIAAHFKAFLPGVKAPDEHKKAASLRRQWYRWAAGQHVPDFDDLGCLLRFARRAGWLPPRGQRIAEVPNNVQDLVNEIDDVESKRRTLEIEQALETNRLELAAIARQLAAISKRLPGRLHDIGSLVCELNARVIEEVSREFPLGSGAPALRSTGKILDEQWKRFAESVESEEREVLALERALVGFENDESLLKEFEVLAATHGLWPEDLNILFRWIKLGPTFVEPGSDEIDQRKLRQFIALLSDFDTSSRRGFDLSRHKIEKTSTRPAKRRSRR